MYLILIVILILLYLQSVSAEALHDVPANCLSPSKWESNACMDDMLDKRGACTGKMEDCIDDMLLEYPFQCSNPETERPITQRSDWYEQEVREWKEVFAMIIGAMIIPFAVALLLAHFMDFVVYKVTSFLRNK